MARALIIVDFQNDFTPGGALAVERGDELAGRINAHARDGGYDLVIATRDWHPPDHSSFTEQGGIWPVHCVQGTAGAQLHPALDDDRVDLVVDTGYERELAGYSGFEATHLEETLRESGVDEVTVVGLATDYCVRATALEALRRGFKVTVDPAAVAAVDVEPGDGERALAELREAGAAVG
jgi:nicotinamidase/pyrazinamidase